MKRFETFHLSRHPLQVDETFHVVSETFPMASLVVAVFRFAGEAAAGPVRATLLPGFPYGEVGFRRPQFLVFPYTRARASADAQAQAVARRHARLQARPVFVFDFRF